jgi:hypothetical protein
MVNDEEAKIFIRELIIAFPMFDEVAKFHSPDLAATHRIWAKVLEKCTLQECREVLDSWLDGSRPIPSRDEAKNIALIIRSIVFEIRFNKNHVAKQESTRVTFACLICEDRGRVEVWRTNKIYDFINGNELKGSLSYVVACRCESGNRISEPNKFWKGLPRYDADQFCKFKNRKRETEIALLEKWLQERTPKNYHNEFASYSGSI